MKKAVVYIILAAFLAVLAPARADSQEKSLNVIAGAGAGLFYLYPKDIQLKDYYSKEFTYRAFAELRAENGLSAVGDISIYSEGNHSTSVPAGTTLTIIPITVSMVYHPIKDTAFSPFFGAGIGIYNISESDPNFSYVSITKFGKHILAGADFYFDKNTILRAELRQAFVDPVNSALYYQANFGGLTASLSLAMEWPLFRSKPQTTEEALLEQKKALLEEENRLINNRIREMQSIYAPTVWGSSVYYPWNSPYNYINVFGPTQQQIDEAKAKAEQLKAEQEKKRQDYIDEKLEKRKQKSGG